MWFLGSQARRLGKPARRQETEPTQDLRAVGTERSMFAALARNVLQGRRGVAGTHPADEVAIGVR
jgi:hypothetical protein